MAGWEGAIVEDDFWVRGPRLDPGQERACARIPWEERFDVIEENVLRHPGRHLPSGVLPSVSWSPLRELLRVRLPLSTSAARLPKRVEIELRSDEEMREPKLLEAATQDWLAFACRAPEIRLRPLSFAFDTTHRATVLIRGTPLPSIPGTQFAEEEGVATPAGYRIWPAVDASVARKSFGANDGELVVLRTDAGWSRVPRMAWIAATRAAVRALLG